MMKKPAGLGLAALLTLGLALQANAQTVEDVLNKMIEAQGGRAVLAAIKDTTASGTMELVQMGMSGGITMYQKEPDKMRMDIEIQGMLITQAYDGQKAWMVNPQTGGVEELSERQTQDFKRQGLGNDALLNPSKFGITYALKGSEKIGDRNCLVLEQSFQDGFKSTLYVDAETYLPVKTRARTEQMGAEIEAETVLDDYRKIEGMMVAHKMTIYQDGSEFGRMIFDRVVFNTGLDEAIFKMR